MGKPLSFPLEGFNNISMVLLTYHKYLSKIFIFKMFFFTVPPTTNCFSFSIGQLCVTFMPGRKLID